MQQLKEDVKDLRYIEGSVKPVSEIESNTMFKRRVDNTRGTDIPVEPLLVLNGTLNGFKVKVLKDDGCNTNVVGKDFLKSQKGRNLFQIREEKVIVEHSKQGTREDATHVLINGTLRLGAHTYTSNWIVADCRYDVLLGMPWHVANNTDIDYVSRIVKVRDVVIPVADTFVYDEVRVTNMGVRSFRKLLRRKRKRKSGTVQIFQVVIRDVGGISGLKSAKNSEKLEKLLSEFNTVFRDDLPEGLPPERSVDHEIDVDSESKPPHRPLFQLSPRELKAAKEYVEKLLKQGKIRPSKSPYGASLFFVKDKNGLRGVVDYRALNRIKKKNNAPPPSI